MFRKVGEIHLHTTQDLSHHDDECGRVLYWQDQRMQQSKQLLLESFRKLSEECIKHREILGHRTCSKIFNLNMCDRIMCFVFHTKHKRELAEEGASNRLQ